MTLFSLCYLLLTTLLSPPDIGTLKLTVDNIQSEEGNIMIALYKSRENFLQEENIYRSAVISAKKPSTHFTFQEIPAGDYAIAIFHDKNADEKLNFNFFFLPKEPYGFSNNFIPRFSKPAFEDTKFSVNGNTKINIKLIH